MRERALDEVLTMVGVRERREIREGHVRYVVGVPNHGIEVVIEKTGEWRGYLFRVDSLRHGVLQLSPHKG